MLAAALGRKRNEAVDDLTELEFGVRVDLPGTKLHDFQVTQMGEKLNANLSNKEYLCDAIFLAGLGCEDIVFLRRICRLFGQKILSAYAAACVRDSQHESVSGAFGGRMACAPMEKESIVSVYGHHTAENRDGWQGGKGHKKGRSPFLLPL